MLLADSNDHARGRGFRGGFEAEAGRKGAPTAWDARRAVGGKAKKAKRKRLHRYATLAFPLRLVGRMETFRPSLFIRPCLRGKDPRPLGRHVHSSVIVHLEHVHAIPVELLALCDSFHHPSHNLFTFLKLLVIQSFTFIGRMQLHIPFVILYVLFFFTSAKIVPPPLCAYTKLAVLAHFPIIFDVSQAH